VGTHCDIEALAEIAARRSPKLLFAAAHAFGCSHEKRMIGRFGDADVFSFHAAKIVNSFKGGAVVYQQ
jgi:dTDP-4-amino-4,6-dideoxygalactose transaminase